MRGYTGFVQADATFHELHCRLLVENIIEMHKISGDKAGELTEASGFAGTVHSFSLIFKKTNKQTNASIIRCRRTHSRESYDSKS